MVKKMPERIIADHHPAIGQLLAQSPQREIRLLGDPRQNPIPLARHKVRPVATHFQRSRTANGALSLRPLHNAGDADHERLGHRAAGLARRHSPNHPLPQVQRIGSSHPSWPPIKSQQVESDSRRFGNAPRFSQSRSRSSLTRRPSPAPGLKSSLHSSSALVETDDQRLKLSSREENITSVATDR